MASALYGKGREKFAGGSIDWATDTIKAILIDTGTYSVAIDTDEFLSDIAAGARVATSAALSSKTNTLGTVDAADETFASVSGASVEAIVLYKDTGVEATSPLIAYIDSGTGLPVTPNGGDITVQWNASGIFTL